VRKDLGHMLVQLLDEPAAHLTAIDCNGTVQRKDAKGMDICSAPAVR
jgi:hypothetical protein